MTEFDALLAPVREESPTGEDVRLSATDLTLQRIAEFRSELEPELDPGGVGRVPDWQALARECETALRTRTKDLEIAVALIEAWTRMHGFRGLCSGLRFLSELCDRYWDRLHPGFEVGEIDLPTRLKPLNQLGRSKAFLRSVDACDLVATGESPRLSWEVFRISQLVDEKSQRVNKQGHAELLERGFFDGATWRARLLAAGPEALGDVHERIVECEAALDALLRLLEKRTGDTEAVNALPLADRLSEIREHVERYGVARATRDAPEAGAPEERQMPAAPSPARAPAERAIAARSASAPSGEIETREHALAILSEVAAYFQKNEPHSPIAALLLRAVRWGNMPFEQVLPELVADPGALERVWDTLGIRPGGRGS